MTKHTETNRSRYLQGLLASTALVASGAGHAQSTPDNQASQRPLEEIVVRGVAQQYRPDDQTTATGLAMALVDTPQSVSVITQDMLSTINASNVYDATDLVPNVQRAGYGFGLERIVMRGIVNENQRLNGILVGQRATSVDSVALERMEVVRGPATSLYGVTGSFGGELNGILKRPEQEFGFSSSASVGSYDTWGLEFDVTGPLTDSGNLSGRLAVAYDEYDHPLDIQGESFPNRQRAGLAALEYRFSPNSVLNLSYIHQHRKVNPWDGAAIVLGADGNLTLPDINPDYWYFSHPDQSNSENEFNIGLVEFEHYFGNGWRSNTQVSYNQYEEFIEYFYPFGPFGAYGLGEDEIYIYTYDIDRDGEEYTFNQSLGGDFEFMGREHQFYAAVEYRDNAKPDRFELLNSQYMGIASMDWYSDEVYDGTPRFVDGTPFEPVSTEDRRAAGVGREQLVDTEELLLSFQVLLNPTDRLQVLAGVLYQDSEQKERAPFLSGVPQDPVEVTKTSFDETVYRFGATYELLNNWQFVDDGRVYYSYSEGFEPQTFIDEAGAFTSAPQEMTQHEVGFKAEMLGGSVGASIALFDYEITNIAVAGTFIGGFANPNTAVLAGTQEARGVEVELIGELLPGWNLSANYGYLDAEIKDPNFDITTPPRGAPKHSASFTSSYEFLEGALNGLRVGGTYKYSGSYAFVEGPSNADRFGPLVAGSHNRVDLHASYTPPQYHNFTVSFNWHNIFDEDIMTAKEGNPGYGVMFMDRQRMSLRVAYQY